MPYLTFSGIPKNTLLEVKEELIDKLSKAFECPKDHLVFRYDEALELHNVFPIVEVKMFKRPRTMMDNAVKVLCNTFRKYNIESLDTVFSFYDKENYYVNEEQI